MNSFNVVKTLTHKNEYAGRNWFYDFRELPDKVIESQCQQVIASLFKRYSKQTQQWCIQSNSEWMCRIYLSAKMIMSATLQLNALEFAKDNNMRLVSPYLAYYSIFSLLRAIVYTIPEAEWDDGKLVDISHRKAIDYAFDHISNFDKDLSSELKRYTHQLKAYRELISYKSPSSGDENIGSLEEVNSTATFLAEIAQLNSEILESSVAKNAKKDSLVFDSQYIEKISTISLGDEEFFDSEDYHRLNYIRRKCHILPNICHIATEGHVEDFFGAWTSSENSKGNFNPDYNWQLIFDFF